MTKHVWKNSNRIAGMFKYISSKYLIYIKIIKYIYIYTHIHTVCVFVCVCVVALCLGLYTFNRLFYRVSHKGSKVICTDRGVSLSYKPICPPTGGLYKKHKMQEKQIRGFPKVAISQM